MIGAVGTKTISIASMFFCAAVVCQRLWIGLMRKMDMGETAKWYGPQSHQKKSGTPSMGGAVALLLSPAAAAVLVVCFGADLDWTIGVFSFPIGAAAVGLLDDGLKRYSRSSEGLKSLQKLAAQLAVSLPWAVYASRGGLELLPGISIGAMPGVMLLTFLCVGFMNAVNVTDGLDGLAAGCTVISLSMAAVIFTGTARVASILFISIALAFLWHNSNPAELFMGDVGAHFWAGTMLSICVFERSALLIVPLGSIFGIEIITVAVQIFAIRKLKRKVFLMSPLHHHFELKGFKETKVTALFQLAHLLGMAVMLAVISILMQEGGLDVVRSH